MREAVLALQSRPSNCLRALTLIVRRTGSEDSGEPDRPVAGEAAPTESWTPVIRPSQDERPIETRISCKDDSPRLSIPTGSNDTERRETEP